MTYNLNHRVVNGYHVSDLSFFHDGEWYGSRYGGTMFAFEVPAFHAVFLRRMEKK